MTKSLREPWPELPAVEVAANRAAWVAALRSGNYRQARRALRRHDSFCCLGVAEDVVDCTWSDRDVSIYGSDYATHVASHPEVPGVARNVVMTTLTRVGAARLGVPVVPWVAYPVEPRDVPRFTTTLVRLNDEHHLSLAQIADVIEAQGEHWDGTWEQANMVVTGRYSGTVG